MHYMLLIPALQILRIQTIVWNANIRTANMVEEPVLILWPYKAQRSSVLIMNILSHIVGHKDSRLRKIVKNWQESSP